MATIDDNARALLTQIAGMWRGDWSSQRYDGRDLHRWIRTILDGGTSELAALKSELDQIEGEY